MPLVAQENSIAYQLPHTKIIRFLETIGALAKNEPDSLWGQTVVLAEYWGIDIQSLTLFYKVYERMKQNYLTALLNDSKRSYESYGDKKAAQFDETGTFTVMKKSVCAKLKKKWKLLDTTNNLFCVYLYNELIRQIDRRVGLSFEDNDSLVALTYQHKDLADLLKVIGYEERFLMSAKKKSKRKPQESSTTQKSSSDKSESEDDAVWEESLPKNSLEHQASLDTDEREFKVQGKQRKRVHTFTDVFAGCKSYTISLFRARDVIPTELQEIQRDWRSSLKTHEAHRVKTLFALADLMQRNEVPIVKINSYGCPFY